MYFLAAESAFRLGSETTAPCEATAMIATVEAATPIIAANKRPSGISISVAINPRSATKYPRAVDPLVARSGARRHVSNAVTAADKALPYHRSAKVPPAFVSAKLAAAIPSAKVFPAPKFMAAKFRRCLHGYCAEGEGSNNKSRSEHPILHVHHRNLLSAPALKPVGLVCFFGWLVSCRQPCITASVQCKHSVRKELWPIRGRTGEYIFATKS